MNALPFYIFLEATGTMALYQESVKFWTAFFQPYQGTMKK